MDPAPSRPDLFSHILSQPNSSNYHLPPVQPAKLSPLSYPSITNNTNVQQPPAAAFPGPTAPPSQHFSSQPFTRTYQTYQTYQQPLLSTSLPQPHPLSPPQQVSTLFRTSHTSTPTSTLTHPTYPNLPSPCPAPCSAPAPSTTLHTFATNLSEQPQNTPIHTASRYTLPGPPQSGAHRLKPSRSTDPDRALYNIQNILDAGCVIDSGNIYNNDGHIICGVSNQHDKPCRRVGKCPFHLYKAPVSASNSTNGVVDHTGTAVMPQNALPSSQPLAHTHNAPAPIVKALKARKQRIPPKRQYKHGWSREEHYLFLEGLDIYGRGCWKQIAAIVASRSPTQVQSHAQKHDQRNKQVNKNKRSIHDLTLSSEEMKEVAHKMRNDPSPRAVSAMQRIESARKSRSGCALMSPLPQANMLGAPTIAGTQFNVQQSHAYNRSSGVSYPSSAAVPGMTGGFGAGAGSHLTQQQQAGALGGDGYVQTNVAPIGAGGVGGHGLRTAYQTGSRGEVPFGTQASTSDSDGMVHGMMKRGARATIYEPVAPMSDAMRDPSIHNAQAPPLMYSGIKGSSLGLYSNSYGMPR